MRTRSPDLEIALAELSSRLADFKNTLKLQLIES
jgi:hypothetical protein